MNYFIVEERTLPLFRAQANLNGTFQHYCTGTQTRERLAFTLQVDRGPADTTFTVQMRDERHSQTLRHNERRVDLCLAEFVEAIANGRLFTAADPYQTSKNTRSARPTRLNTQQAEQLLLLICKGGFLELDLELGIPLQVALHRTKSRDGITAILNLGSLCPQTTNFTVYGKDLEAYDCLTDSIEHLVTSRLPGSSLA